MVCPELWGAHPMPERNANEACGCNSNSQNKTINDPTPDAVLLLPVQHSSLQIVQSLAHEERSIVLCWTYQRQNQLWEAKNC